LNEFIAELVLVLVTCVDEPKVAVGENSVTEQTWLLLNEGSRILRGDHLALSFIKAIIPRVFLYFNEALTQNKRLAQER